MRLELEVLVVEVEGQEGEENGAGQMRIGVHGLVVEIEEAAERAPRRARCWPRLAVSKVSDCRDCRVGHTDLYPDNMNSLSFCQAGIS